MQNHEVKEAVDGLMSAFSAFKKMNDERLASVERKGHVPADLNEKLARIEAAMSQGEGRMQASRRGREIDGETKARASAWIRGVARVPVVGMHNLSKDEQKALTEPAAELKALNVSSDTAGGYLAPSEYVREMIKDITEVSPMRQLARVRPTTGKSIILPKRTGVFAARRVTEQGTRTETTGLTYGQEEIPAPEMYALVDVSMQMVEDSAFDIEAELRADASEQFALKEGAEVVNGTGLGECAGFLGNTSVQTTNSGTATTIADADGQANGLINLFHAVKTDYARNGTWVLNRLTLASIRRMKSTDKSYIWQPPLAPGLPGTILGAPYVEVPDMPNEGAGLKPIAFGDWRAAYAIADRIEMQLLRDPYTQATSGNVRFVVRRRVGGQTVLPQAIRTLTCATS